MLLRPKAICPSCQGGHCRESRWHSVEEKRRHPGCRPFRCEDCAYRFLRPQVADRGGVLSDSRVLMAGAAAVLIALVAAVGFWLSDGGASTQAHGGGANVLLDPAVRQAAEGGDALAQFRLGEALYNDPARNDETATQAIRWLQSSAESGNTDAMIFLGRLSRTGVGILQNFAQASKWIHTAAVRGSPEGMLEMGRLYRDGVGVERDLVKAYVWFNRASAARNLDAVREREGVARILTPDELREAQKQSSAAAHESGVAHDTHADKRR